MLWWIENNSGTAQNPNKVISINIDLAACSFQASLITSVQLHNTDLGFFILRILSSSCCALLLAKRTMLTINTLIIYANIFTSIFKRGQKILVHCRYNACSIIKTLRVLAVYRAHQFTKHTNEHPSFTMNNSNSM